VGQYTIQFSLVHAFRLVSLTYYLLQRSALSAARSIFPWNSNSLHLLRHFPHPRHNPRFSRVRSNLLRRVIATFARLFITGQTPLFSGIKENVAECPIDARRQCLTWWEKVDRPITRIKQWRLVFLFYAFIFPSVGMITAVNNWSASCILQKHRTAQTSLHHKLYFSIVNINPIQRRKLHSFLNATGFGVLSATVGLEIRRFLPF